MVATTQLRGDGAMSAYAKILKERSSMLSIYEALQLMIDFAGLIVAILILVVEIIVHKTKK